MQTLLTTLFLAAWCVVFPQVSGQGFVDCMDELCSPPPEAPAPSRRLLQNEEGPTCVAMAGDCVYEEGISDLDTFCYCIDQPVCDTFLSIADLSICSDKKQKILKDSDDFEFRPIDLSNDKGPDSQLYAYENQLIVDPSEEYSKSEEGIYQQEIHDSSPGDNDRDAPVEYEDSIEDNDHGAYQNVDKLSLSAEEDGAQYCPKECLKIFGEKEGDVLRGSEVCNCFFPRGGMNSIYPSQGTNFIIGASEDDLFFYEDGQIDIFVGEDGSMEVDGCSEDSTIEFLRGSQCWDGNSDEPLLLYRRSNSCVIPICKDRGIYVLVKGGGDATVFGTPYNDIIKTGSGSDRIYGLGGDDELSGGPRKDYVDGGSGEDTVLFAADDELLNIETII